MYIIYKDANYHCSCRPAETMVYRGLPEDFPATVEGEVILCADDGFVLRIDNSADYLRQTFINGILTLTNTPEPEQELEPAIPTPSLKERVDELEAQLAESDEVAIELYEAHLAQEAINAEQDEAIIEIYEMMEGTTNG